MHTPKAVLRSLAFGKQRFIADVADKPMSRYCRSVDVCPSVRPSVVTIVDCGQTVRD